MGDTVFTLSNTSLATHTRKVVCGDNADAPTVPQMPQETSQRSETQTEIPASITQDGGIINLGFVGSRCDPDAPVPPKSPAAVGTLKSQIYAKPLLYFIHGAGESTESWK